MELNKEHRASLIDALESANEDLSIQEKCLKDAIDKDNGLDNRFEINIYLLQEKIKTIKKAIEENQIDF